MRDIIGQFAARIRRLARPRPQRVSVSAMGRNRVFCCFDWGSDSFIFEKDILKNWENHLPVLVVRKSELNKGQNGRIMTFTSGNHATAAIPFVPICLVIMTCFTGIYVTAYLYLYYRWLIDL